MLNISYEGNYSVAQHKKQTNVVWKVTGWLENVVHDVHMYVIWLKWPERESDHKTLYNVEITCAAIILSLYMTVRSI